MANLAPTSDSCTKPCAPRESAEAVIWLQLITIGWMLVECGISLFAARAACSTALLAFGSDSFVELLSASVVLLQYAPRFTLSQLTARRAAAMLLFLLAAVVACTAVGALVFGVRAESSKLGMAITIAALIAMPILAALKRREAHRRGDAALAADSVQSAICAYLALITLAGLAANVTFGIAWLDPVAALLAIPLLIKEGMSSWKGHACGCC